MSAVTRKFIPPEELSAWRSRVYCDSWRTGATSGCYDLLHPGHVRFLQEASARCGLLIVCLNSDQSIRRLKGPNRPIIPEQERIEMLCALRCVDYVTLFNAMTPEGLIPIIKPGTWFKGQEYAVKEMPERDIVEAHGGQIVLLPYHHGYSTTALINRIKNMEEIEE